MDRQLITASQNGNLDKVKRLVESGADVNSQTIYNDTPLHYASQYGHLPIVEFLI
jgi:serine/threonine-protein phosphatase 6 regulatory ankyrin repeat subunit B